MVNTSDNACCHPVIHNPLQIYIKIHLYKYIVIGLTQLSQYMQIFPVAALIFHSLE